MEEVHYLNYYLTKNLTFYFNMKKASEGKGICVFICGDCIKAIQKKKVWSGDTV
jgi:hypothetical protein